MGISPMGNSGIFPQWKTSCNRVNYPILINYKVRAGSYRVSTTHRTLTWTTWALTCVRDHSYACVYTRGLGTPTASQHNICYSEKLSQIFLGLLTQTGFEPRVFWISSPTFYQLSHPVTRKDRYLMFYAQSTAKGQGPIKAKQNVFLPQVKNLIHYSIHMPSFSSGYICWVIIMILSV